MDIKKILVGLSALLTMLSLSVSATTVEQNLERRLKTLPSQTDLLNTYKISKLIKTVANAARNDDRFKCEEVSFIENSSKFKTSYDADGNPCRTYDLSFPTLMGAKSGINKLASIPLTKYEPEAYLKWLEGDFDHIASKTQQYISSFSTATYRNSWAAKLPFKKNLAKNKSGIVKSFYLSDLEMKKFSFTTRQKRDLAKLFATSNKGSALNNMQVFVNNPNAFLNKIKFDWNDLSKVYDVFVEFDFLPLKGPVVLVDYNAQYKFVVEKMIRTTMQKALIFIAKKIKNKNANRVVQLAINESFGFLDMAYTYHLNQLENTLRLNLEGTLPTDVSKLTINKGMNIVFASQESLITQYLTGLITGQAIDLERLDKMGKVSRYTVEKQRRSTMKNLFSALTLKKKCEMTVVNRYFGECVTENSDKFLYSLLSSHKVLIWDFGATKIHNYQSPKKIAMLRKSAYLLSSALAIFKIQLVPDWITNQLVTILKDYSLNGAVEEGVMLNELTELGRINGLSDEQQYHVDFLFKQNFNPFLANSLEMENNFIESATH